MIFRRRKRRQPPAPFVSEATRARKKAEVDLDRTREETPRIRELAEALRTMREHNNFAAAIETSFRGGKK